MGTVELFHGLYDETNPEGNGPCQNISNGLNRGFAMPSLSCATTLQQRSPQESSPPSPLPLRAAHTTIAVRHAHDTPNVISPPVSTSRQNH